MTSLTIGQLSEQTGEAAHVLRHWEDVGLLRPRRTASGHRRYDPGTVAAVRTVRRLQRVGLSLADIVALHRSTKDDRRARFAAHRARLVDDRAAIDAALGFLEHTMECAHPVIDDCGACSAFARGGAVRAADHDHLGREGDLAAPGVRDVTPPRRPGGRGRAPGSRSAGGGAPRRRRGA